MIGAPVEAQRPRDPMLPYRRTIRRQAAALLLAWVFALVSGVVNACIVGLDAGGADHVAGHGHSWVAAETHDHGPVPEVTTPCAKFCDDESSSVPPAPGSTAQVSFGAWMAPAPLPAWTAPVRRGGPDAFIGPAAEGPGRIPIPIAFLRLAL